MFHFCVFWAALSAQLVAMEWEQLKNPVWQNEFNPPDTTRGNKDPSLIYRAQDECFYLFFSEFFKDEAGDVHCQVALAKTQDFKSYQRVFTLNAEALGWRGVCSPNVIEVDGVYYMTYNRWGDKPGLPNQLFYATSKDCETWEFHLPLAHDLTAGQRAIDAAVTYDAENERWVLFWKEGQNPVAAYSENITGPWTRLGDIYCGDSDPWFENADFFKFEGQWHFLATDNQHSPVFARMISDGSNAEDWTRWTELKSTGLTDNSADILDRTQTDGYFYLISGYERHDPPMFLYRSKRPDGPWLGAGEVD